MEGSSLCGECAAKAGGGKVTCTPIREVLSNDITSIVFCTYCNFLLCKRALIDSLHPGTFRSHLLPSPLVPSPSELRSRTTSLTIQFKCNIPGARVFVQPFALLPADAIALCEPIAMGLWPFHWYELCDGSVHVVRKLSEKSWPSIADARADHHGRLAHFAPSPRTLTPVRPDSLPVHSSLGKLTQTCTGSEIGFGFLSKTDSLYARMRCS